MHNGHDLERVRSALHAIPPDIPREEWVRVGMAAHAAGLTFDEFNTWSAAAGNYDFRAARSAWRSFKPGRGIGPGTLFRAAREAGWRDDRGTPAQAHRKPPARPQEAPKSREAGESAAAIWARLAPAAGQHPYIVAKDAQGVPLDAMRVVPAGDPLQVAGVSMAGALVVPMLPLGGGEPTSLQFIAGGELAHAWKTAGRPPKLNLPGPQGGGVFTVGQVVPGGDAFIVEGVATAWACWRATGRPVVVTFGKGRTRAVAQALRERDPSARLVLVPDAGAEPQAEEIARELGALVAAMPEGSPTNFDAADLAQRDGVEALERLLEAARPPDPPPLPFALVPLADLQENEPPAPAFVWEGLIPAETVTLLSAHGGTGKSFVALMLAVSVALGLPLFGLATRQGKAAFFSGEDGAAVLRHRLRYVCARMGVDIRQLDGRLFVIDATEGDPRLYVETAGRRDGELTATFEALDAFLKREGIGLLVLDNASDTFDASEIDRARVRAFMRALTVLARQHQAGVLLLAHVDKGTSRGDREPNTEGYSGSTAWHNSSRSRLFMVRDAEGAIVLKQQKATHSAGLMAPLRLAWVRDGIPTLDEPLSPMMQGLADKGATKALLKLIHEFTQRGEWVASTTSSRSNAARLMSRERTYPRLKDREVFDVLRQAERAGQLERVTYRGPDRKARERWAVTPEGREFARIAASAAGAATTEVAAQGAPAAEPAASAATAQGGMGGRARTPWDEIEAQGTPC